MMKFDIKDTVADFSDDTMYCYLNAMVDDAVIGFLFYGVFEDTPFVNMIQVNEEFQRKGIATQLFQELQKKYPDKEIEIGYTTPDGTCLLDAISFEVVDEKALALVDENKALHQALDEVEQRLDALYEEKENAVMPLDEEQDYYDKCEEYGAQWDKLYQEVRNSDEAVRNLRASHRFIYTGEEQKQNLIKQYSLTKDKEMQKETKNVTCNTEPNLKMQRTAKNKEEER